MIYVTDSIDVILAKSNAWYVRHYETYFDRVYMVYLRGSARAPLAQGRTTLVPLGTGRSKLDFLLAPLHLYRFARKTRPDVYLTWDQIWGWWISWAVRWLLGARVYLMPQFMPEQIYKSSRRSVSVIFPIWLERALIRLSYATADRILTGNCFGSYTRWLRSARATRRKTVVAETLAEALPPPAFLEKIDSTNGSGPGAPGATEEFRLIYVGRLQRQKLVDDLVRMMPLVAGGAGPQLTLTLVGDGPERGRLEKLAEELGVRRQIDFAGQVDNEELPEYLMRSHAYVSPLTGMSLREAAVCGLPVVAYEMDWIEGLLEHEETALLVPPGDYAEMGRQVLRLRADESLRRKLSANIRGLARRLWSSESLRESLRAVFEEAGTSAARPRLKSLR